MKGRGDRRREIDTVFSSFRFVAFSLSSQKLGKSWNISKYFEHVVCEEGVQQAGKRDKTRDNNNVFVISFRRFCPSQVSEEVIS